MEIIIGLVILGGIVWFFFMRDDKKTEVAAPYKVEAFAPVADPVKVEAPKVEVISVGTEASIAAPTNVKAPAKPKAPAKTAAKAPAKTAKAKAKAPAKPKVTVAK